jgi:hypothetical protein
MTSHGFLGPDPRLTPLHGDSYPLDGAVGFLVLWIKGQDDAVRRAERIIRLQARGIHLGIPLISPRRPAGRYP